MTCETCEQEYNVERLVDSPVNAESMKCNWCPECQDNATDYYKESYYDNNNNLIET